MQLGTRLLESVKNLGGERVVFETGALSVEVVSDAECGGPGIIPIADTQIVEETAVVDAVGSERSVGGSAPGGGYRLIGIPQLGSQPGAKKEMGVFHEAVVEVGVETENEVIAGAALDIEGGGGIARLAVGIGMEAVVAGRQPQCALETLGEPVLLGKSEVDTDIVGIEAGVMGIPQG